MQEELYESMSNIELYSRLHFLENHTRYQSDELAKKQQKIDSQAEEIKELKTELNRITEFLKLAGKKIYGSSTERISEDYGQLSFFTDSETEADPVKNCTDKGKFSYKKKALRP